MTVSDLRRALAERIESLAEHAADVLMELIRYPSVCGEEMEVVNYIKEIMESIGLKPEIIPLDPAIKSHHEYTMYTKEPPWEGRGNLVTDYGGIGKGHSLIVTVRFPCCIET